MSKKKIEKKFWQKLKLGLGLEYLKRLENSVEPGWPDTHFLHHGHGGWIELKAEDKFPANIDFEPAQPLWLSKYWNLGGTCYVMLYVAEEDKIYLWAGKFARELDKSTQDVEPMMAVKCNNKGWQELYEFFSVHVK